MMISTSDYHKKIVNKNKNIKKIMANKNSLQNNIRNNICFIRKTLILLLINCKINIKETFM